MDALKHSRLPRAIIDSSQMVAVKTGTFWMGDDQGEYDDEKPAHKVQLHDYLVGKYPVTQAFWLEVMKETDIADPAAFKGLNRPVESVSWEDVIRFCNIYSQQKGIPPAYDEEGQHIDENGKPTSDIRLVKGYRLLTEAEWEFAAMGGHLAPQKNGIHYSAFKYAGSTRLEEVGWHDGNSGSETKPVGLKMPNPLGLFDMSGNVREWCWDWFDGKYYEKCKERGTVKNPLGPETGSDRVYRGGSWVDFAQLCRVAYRLNWYPVPRLVGFRLALSLQ